MTSTSTSPADDHDSYWCFAIINNRLAEVFFHRDKKGEPIFDGHCFVNKSEYKTKSEQRWIEEDTQKLRLTYYRQKYRWINRPREKK